MSNKLLKYQEKVVMNGHRKQLKAPFVIFASCESNLKELQKYNGNNTSESYTDKYQDHITWSYGFRLSLSLLRNLCQTSYWNAWKR